MKFQYILALLLLFVGGIVKAQDFEEGSCQQMIDDFNSMDDSDTMKLVMGIQIGAHHYNVDTVMKYSQATIDIAEKLNIPIKKAEALLYLSWGYSNFNKTSESNQCLFESILISSAEGNSFLEGKAYYHLGCNYANIRDFMRADEALHKGIDAFEKCGDNRMISVLYKVLCQVFVENDRLQDAKNAIEKSFQNDSTTIHEYYFYLGSILRNEFLANDCKDTSLIFESDRYNAKALSFSKLINDQIYIYKILIQICANIVNEIPFGDKKMLCDSMLANINACYDIIKITEQDFLKPEVDYYCTQYLINTGKFREAKVVMDSLEQEFSTDPEGYASDIVNLYQVERDYYMAIGDYRKAMEFTELYYKQSKIKIDWAVQASGNMAQDEFDAKMNRREAEELARETRHRVILFSVLIILITVFLLGVYIAILLKRSKNLNSLLNEKNSSLILQKEEINSQKEEIEAQREYLEEQNKIIKEQNLHTKQSIEYASLIQQAILPSQSQMDSLFNDNFVIYRPKDIVSGDFYWVGQVDRFKILVTADCTGHGVPGGFMSVLGISLLNEICLSEGNAIDAAGILDQMRIKLKDALHQNLQSESSPKDGIDLALWIFDEEKHILNYSGAYRPLCVVHDGKLVAYAADKMPIGAHVAEKEHFTNQIIEVCPGDIFYTFSDGMSDQFGYDADGSIRKFSQRNFKKLLEEVSCLPMAQQRDEILSRFSKWQVDEPQLDDWVLIGVRF